jgi:TIR domain
MNRLFFSYSHRDEELRDELETHLAALKRQGIIETWHDRRIGAGKEFENEISENLEKADIILLLVSSDFIASDYCYGVEVRRALKRHNSGEALVIPVILRPCDWHNLLFGRLLATPTDGKPVTKFPDRDDAFLEIVRAIRKAAEELAGAGGSGARDTIEVSNTGPSRSPVAQPPSPSIMPDVRSGNLRIKRAFTDHEKDRFLDEAFEYIANYFEGSLAELEQRNPDISTRFKRVDSDQFTAAIYSGGALASSCRIWMGGRQTFGGIAYSASERSFGNSMNESWSVDDEGYSLFLKPLLGAVRGRAEKQLTHEGGAEHFWSNLIEPLQR